ncbi:chromogranin-A isoform X2 [Mustela lutreola]|uniref:chromogranin-A isoform X2 n=1 Tax=Mustela lutreola TaxID=9666 RepID=UPI002797A59B|nr:chromogranin-A isoform X2 [Mustela lutreola]
MRSAAVLALLFCAGQVIAFPVNSPMNKGDTEVMKCIVEVISDTLSKPSPMPVSQECFETLRGDERILSILRHQNLLKELQDLALQGAKERAHQKKHSSFEDGLSEALEKQNDQAELTAMGEVSSKDATEKREDPKETENGGDTDGARPQASPEPGQGSKFEEDSQALGEQEAANPDPRDKLPSQKHPDPLAEEDSQSHPQGLVDREKVVDAEKGQQTKREEEEKEGAEAGEKAVPEEGPTEAFNPHPSLSYKETQRGETAPGWSEALAIDGARKSGAEEAQRPQGKGERAHSRQEEEMAEAPQGPFLGGKNRELEREQEEEQLSKKWEDAKEWSKMDQLAKGLTAKKRLEGEDEEDDPDRSMKLSFRARAYNFGGPELQLRRGWRPSSQEDSVEAGLPLQVRSYPEEKKEEEGSANRRPEDQELESLAAIKAELEKVAHQLQALRWG